ncbi:MAG: selenide, water dikinase SelD [Veillonella sp.]|uniref:selenide, water dikinase SelD n=1 Tax=Veillonella sp. TaxID=1926307 RepID=UPI0029003C96|nr:selenide, water dikinase SelD [Veillonella sp.]MDU2067352.1 selenide, water dikinase SelD [Veillonella sp.]MDU3280942.1 selenide, water dikinase SelD [Veillonella sp.]
MVRLTDYVTSGGCACKIGPHILERVLKAVTPVTNEHVLADMTGADDAGVYKISDRLALVQTLDFFTPVVDDPTLFGKIAAANALSDVYAMGGIPLTAMNIVGFPVPLVEQGVLTDVLNGAASIVSESGAAIVGGHSIENKEPIFGMSITGQVNPNEIWKNKGARVGDVLVLTKCIGTGIMNNALKADLFPTGTAQAVASMSTLNRVAAEVAHNFTIHACTDVTGFSLMGHSVEMASASNVTIHIKTYDIPLFDDVIEAARMGLVPAASYGNRKAITDVQVDKILDSVWTDILFDPQTSGGLLFSVPATEGADLVKALHDEGVEYATIVGTVESFSGLAVRVTK